jgi:hypothetical protein
VTRAGHAVYSRARSFRLPAGATSGPRRHNTRQIASFCAKYLPQIECRAPDMGALFFAPQPRARNCCSTKSPLPTPSASGPARRARRIQQILMSITPPRNENNHNSKHCADNCWISWRTV